MSKRAEEAVSRACPRAPFGPQNITDNDRNRQTYIKGYRQAEKDLAMSSPLPEDTVLFQKGVEEGRRLEKDDLALTWEDMANIDAIILDVNNEFAVDYSKEIDRQKFYEEVLKRFNEIRKK